MISHLAAHLALRNRALAYAGPTTGSITLDATATGYHRASGSFVTDGFKAGMEITPSGCTSNPVDTIKAVTATDLTTVNGRTVEASASGRTIAVLFPAYRAWENIAFTPVQGRNYIDEDYVPATSEILTSPASGGVIQQTGLYILKWYFLATYGVAGAHTCMDGLAALFTPGTNLTAGSDALTVQGKPGPEVSQLLPLTSGYAVITLTVPWWARSTNTIT